MVRFHPGAIAAILLLTISGPSFAAKRIIQTSDAKAVVRSQSRAIKSRNSAIHQYRDDSYSYGREADPYAPGVNWPKCSGQSPSYVAE